MEESGKGIAFLCFSRKPIKYINSLIVPYKEILYGIYFCKHMYVRKLMSLRTSASGGHGPAKGAFIGVSRYCQAGQKTDQKYPRREIK